jgi:hypothetical protein
VRLGLQILSIRNDPDRRSPATVTTEKKSHGQPTDTGSNTLKGFNLAFFKAVVCLVVSLESVIVSLYAGIPINADSNLQWQEQN